MQAPEGAYMKGMGHGTKGSASAVYKQLTNVSWFRLGSVFVFSFAVAFMQFMNNFKAQKGETTDTFLQ